MIETQHLNVVPLSFTHPTKTNSWLTNHHHHIYPPYPQKTNSQQFASKFSILDQIMSKSNTQILQELEQLSDSMYQAHTSSSVARRTASLSLPRTAVPPILDEIGDDKIELNLNPKPRSRRLSLSPFKSRPKQASTNEGQEQSTLSQSTQKSKWADDKPATEKKGIRNWKPIRALSHIAMQKLSCLFSVEVVAVQNLPATMNGLRLSVSVRKKERRDGAVQTMPSRVTQSGADFEETLFIRCHVYFTPGSGTHMKFEPRPFLIYVVAVDAGELDFGKSSVDLSGLIQESIDKSFEGTRVRQWDTTFKLTGKAKGGELVLKLGFQIMEKDGGVGIYSLAEGQKSKKSPSVARKQTKSSFSVPSPRMKSRAEAWTPSQKGTASDDHLQGMDDLNLDEPAPLPLNSGDKKVEEKEVEEKIEDVEMPDFEVVDKGVEIQEEDVDDQSEANNSDKRSISSEVVKEVVQDESRAVRFTELDSIAQQIKALESMMGSEGEGMKIDEETGSQTLDADEDKVTREFLQMLEGVEDDNVVDDDYDRVRSMKYEEENEADSKVFLPDLGKGLGCVVQTRNGGYLAALNPLDNVVTRKDVPKLAMQMSKPMVIQSNKIGFEVFQKMAGIGVQEMTSEILSLMPMDELVGKTAEQIAFEGIASAIIQGRDKEGASSSAARTIATVKSMASAMNVGRQERVSTGIWNVSETPLTVDEILAFSMQKIECMAIEALKIQAQIAEEEAPFDVSPLDARTTAPNGKVYDHVLASAVGVEDWVKGDTVTISVVVQLRDPCRQYEGVGGPMIALIHASAADEKEAEDERKYKVGSLQVGGVRVAGHETKIGWDTEKQKLTALQWLMAYGMGKKGKPVASKGPDLLWSLSSRIMADMWLKPIRNPDVKFNVK